MIIKHVATKNENIIDKDYNNRISNNLYSYLT